MQQTSPHSTLLPDLKTVLLSLARRRPTSATYWWDDHPDIFAGRDGEAGGTWMGITRGGRVAVLTNFTEAKKKVTLEHEASPPSRGELPVGFLKVRTRRALVHETTRSRDSERTFKATWKPLIGRHAMVFSTHKELIYR